MTDPTTASIEVTGTVRPDDVAELVQRLERLKSDPEGFHCDEDALHVTVLRSIADGTCTDPAECARLAASTADWPDARRWYS